MPKLLTPSPTQILKKPLTRAEAPANGQATHSPSPGKDNGGSPEARRRDSRDSRASQVFKGYRGPVGDLCRYLADYVAMPPCSAPVIAAWVLAAWLMDVWDRFPHLCISSPEKRCGKTTLLDLLFSVVP